MDPQSFKITIVGEAAIGKTSLIKTYTQNEFVKSYEPTVYDSYTTSIEVDDDSYHLTVWDTAGYEGCDRIRPRIYTGVNSIYKSSFDNILTKWYPEIKRYSSNIPTVLVGLKSELRIPISEKYVSQIAGLKLRRKIQAYAAIECSALKNENISEVFENAVRAIRFRRNEKPCCPFT